MSVNFAIGSVRNRDHRQDALSDLPLGHGMSLDPEASWIQWAIAVGTAVTAVFSGMVGLFVSFGRDAFKIYREKVDKLEEKHATLAASCITRDELKEYLDEIKADRVRMHAENIDNLREIRNDIKELRK